MSQEVKTRTVSWRAELAAFLSGRLPVNPDAYEVYCQAFEHPRVNPEMAESIRPDDPQKHVKRLKVW